MRARVYAFVFASVVSSAFVLAAPKLPAKADLEAGLDRAGWYLDYFGVLQQTYPPRFRFTLAKEDRGFGPGVAASNTRKRDRRR